MDVNPYQPPTAPIEPPPRIAEASSLEVYLPNAGRATAAVATLALCLGSDVLATAASVHRIAKLREIESGVFSMAEVQTSDTFNAAAGGLQFLALIACAVAFCLWFHRAYHNLAAQGGVRSFTTGWAPGGFFVPILNLVRPFQIAREIWTQCAPTDSDGMPEPGHGPVSLWWGLFLTSNMVANLAWRLPTDETAGSLMTTTYVLIVSDALNIGAALAAIRMVREIERRQAAKHEATRAHPVFPLPTS